MKWFASLTNSRKEYSTSLLLVGSVVTLVAAGVIYILPVEKSGFWALCKGMFFIFTAPAFVAAGLLLFTKMPEDWALGFGSGLYYGTAFGAILLGDWYPAIANDDRRALAFVFTALVCYIVYEKMCSKQTVVELQNMQYLRKRLEDFDPAIRLVECFADKAGMSVPEYVRYLRIQAKVAQGMSEDAAICAIEQEDVNRRSQEGL